MREEGRGGERGGGRAGANTAGPDLSGVGVGAGGRGGGSTGGFATPRARAPPNARNGSTGEGDSKCKAEHHQKIDGTVEEQQEVVGM